jgi:hypothetical protein
MAMKQPGRKVYRSMQGKTVDMDLLRQRNELTPAVGNAKVNARGDELGHGGKIIRKKEEILKDYYAASKGVVDEQAVKQGTQPTQAELDSFEEFDEGWVEDNDGNFVKKGK